MLVEPIFNMLTEDTRTCPLSFCPCPSLTAMVSGQFSVPQFPCLVSRENAAKFCLPRRTRKMDVHVYKVALSNLRKTASEKYRSLHDY